MWLSSALVLPFRAAACPEFAGKQVETSGQMPRRAIELRRFGKERGRDPAERSGLLGVFR